jgi:hypothetical protein
MQAKVPGYTAQAGQLLNSILSDLCQTYDLDVAKGTFNFNFNPGLQPTGNYPNLQPGAGPYPLPADFLRMVDDKDAMWFLLGVPYPMIPCDLSEYDNLVQQAGLQSYPYIFATDMSASPPNLLVYPPPSGSYPCMIRYRRQMPDIATPETSATVPWFPNQQYLLTRLSGELMRISDDERAQVWLGDSEVGAVGILDRYLKMKDDATNRAKTVKLDRRTFGRKFSALKNTKNIGWTVTALFATRLAYLAGLGLLHGVV